MTTSGKTTSSTVFRIQSGNVEYTATIVGDIGLSAQSGGATIEFETATFNTIGKGVNSGGGTGVRVWLDVDAPFDFFDNFTETSGSIVAFSPTDFGPGISSYSAGVGSIIFTPLLPADEDIAFAHFKVTFSEPVTPLDPGANKTIIVPGDSTITLGLSIYHTELGDPEFDPDFGLVHLEFTSDGPLPGLPRLFTDAQKAKFQSDADALKTIGTAFSALGAGASSNPAANAANQLATQATTMVSPQVGTVNSALQTALSLADGMFSVPTSPISLIFGLTGMLNNATVGILEYLANLDPPDGNYLEVFDAPDWSFGNIAGAGAAGNALVRDAWALFQEALNLLAAAERFQGAELAGDVSAQAAQEAAFDAALDRYNLKRVTVSESLEDYLVAVRSTVADVNIEDDTSLADLQAYFAGLTDPATEDPQLAALIASMTDALPGLQAQPSASAPSFIEQAVMDALDAIEAAIPSGLTGSAFDAIQDAAVDLATSSGGAATFTIGAAGDFGTIAAAMASGLLAEGDTIHLMKGLNGEDAAVSVDDLTFKGTAANTDITLTLGAGIGAVTLTGLAPVDVTGNGGKNVIVGNAGANVVNGGKGLDTLKGNGGSDVLRGGAGADTLNGGAAADVLTGGNGSDLLRGGAGGDTMDGGARADRLLGQGGNDRMTGGTGGDTLIGGAGGDTLLGGTGNDLLKGGSGSDLMFGGAGNDLLWGGRHRDTFQFAKNGGDDTIRDFADDIDTIRLDNQLWAADLGRAQVLRRFGEEIGGDVILTFQTGTLTIEDTTLDALRNDLVIV